MSSPVNFVILAAGRGERFAIEGISVPKPLIEFRGRSLLQHSVETARALSPATGRVIVVTTEAVAPSAERLLGVDHVVTVSVTQPGPVASALLALAHCPATEPVVFMDCDNFYPGLRADANTLPFEMPFLTVAEPPAGLSVRDFLNVRVDTNGSWSTLQLEEKGALPNCYVGTGIYGFTNAQQFRYHAMKYFFADHKKEPPMSQVMASVLKEQYVVAIELSPWMPIGTPQQMMEAARHANQEPI
jgi:NDP-sugar pyrophosphorylase family protein